MISSFSGFLIGLYSLAGTHQLARGDDVREWHLPDLFSIQYDPKRHDVGPCHFDPLYTVRWEARSHPKLAV